MEGPVSRATTRSKDEVLLANELRRQKTEADLAHAVMTRKMALDRAVEAHGGAVVRSRAQRRRAKHESRPGSQSSGSVRQPGAGGVPSNSRSTRFRPAHARVGPRNTLFYSTTGDGEDIGNPGYYYEASRGNGVVYGLFGVRMNFGVAQP